MNRARGYGRQRRQPPPEATGREDEFLAALVEGRREVELLLPGGRRLQGRLVAFDADALTVLNDQFGEIRVERREIRAVAETPRA